MKRQRFLADLITHPWAILDSYRPLVADVLANLIAGNHGMAAGGIVHPRPHLVGSGAPAAFDDDERQPRPRPAWEARRASDSVYTGTIALVPVHGVLTQRGQFDDMSEPTTSMSGLAATLTQLANDQTIGAIVLDVDSPGGSVYGLQELGDTIYGLRGTKPIAAVANSLAASAAYWTASQAGEFYVSPGGEVGSIGVFTEHWNLAERMKQLGISVEIIKAGKYKAEGNEYGPLSDDARANIQGTVDQYYDAFVRAVARGRGASLKAVREGMGQGRVLQGEAAVAENMVDGIATLGQVIDKVAAKVRRSSPSARAAMQRETDILDLG